MYDRHMQLQTNSPTDWPKLLSVVKEVESTDPKELFFVDIGGGSGRQVEELRKQYPEAKGRFILQDLGSVIAMARNIPEKDKFCYNVMEPQHLMGESFAPRLYSILRVVLTRQMHGSTTSAACCTSSPTRCVRRFCAFRRRQWARTRSC